MLSGKEQAEPTVRKLVNRDLSALAPRFRAAVEAALLECRAHGLDPVVYDGLRGDEVQRAYYALGRTVRPPEATVTDTASALGSWHGYGLAVDVVSKLQGWRFSMEWITRVAAIFKSHGCEWGGDAPGKDFCHFQWGRCRATPSAGALQLVQAGGLAAVWAEVGADMSSASPLIRTAHTLGRGDRDPHVVYVQQQLGIDVDGVFGPETEAAVRAFQQSRGLPANGIVGPETAAALASGDDGARVA
jgi:hypothetical protein